MPLKLSKTVFGMKAAVKIRRQQAGIGHLILSLQEASDSFCHAVSLQEQQIKLKMESCCHIWVGAAQTSLLSSKSFIQSCGILLIFHSIMPYNDCGECVSVQIQKRP